MTGYIIRRLLYMLPTLLLISFFIFVIIRIQPGDPFSGCELTGRSKAECEKLRDENVRGNLFVQYVKWVWGIISRGDFGETMLYEKQSALWMLFAQNRLFYSLLLVAATTLFAWLIAIPIGVYSATHRYTIADHAFTFLGFVGLAIPNFFLALLLLWILVFTGVIGKLEVCGRMLGVSAEVIHLYYHNAPWDKCKILTFLWYLWPAVLIIGTGNMAMLIRYMRGNLLDILGEPYVQTARAKGLKERIVTWKHALRNAINPLISILGFWIPSMFEGTLVAVAVVNWPTVERTFYQALDQQDQYTIMGALLFFGAVLMLGNLLADILLAWADPRIRYE